MQAWSSASVSAALLTVIPAITGILMAILTGTTDIRLTATTVPDITHGTAAATGVEATMATVAGTSIMAAAGTVAATMAAGDGIANRATSHLRVER